MGDETFTKAQLDEQVAAAVAAAAASTDQRIADAVAEAVGPLNTELETLRAASQSTEVKEAVAAATADLQTQLADIQGQLATKDAELAAMTGERDTLKATIDADADAKLRDERKGERVEAIKAIRDGEAWAKFADENGDAWAELNDEAWAAKVAEVTSISDTIGAPAGGGGPAGLPAPTPLPSRPTAIVAGAGEGGGADESPASQLIKVTAAALTKTPATTGN